MLNNGMRVRPSCRKFCFSNFVSRRGVKKIKNKKRCSPYPKLFTDARNLLDVGHVPQAVETLLSQAPISF